MKMESFLGFRVRLDLQDGAVMEGVIYALDEPRQLITLSEVTFRNEGKTSKFPGLLEVHGGDVVNLEILPHIDAESAPTIPAMPTMSSGGSKKASPAKKKNDAWLAASSRSKKEDLAALKKEDFDFQANLQLFDKKAIFSQIQAEDTTSVDERLVSHNLSGRGHQIKAEQAKMKHTESVLGRPLEDAEQEERILSLRSPIMVIAKKKPTTTAANMTTKTTSLLFKTANGMVIDPASFGQASSKHLWIQVEEAGRSLAAFLADQSPKAVEFFCGASAFIDAAIYCAARHLTMSGIHAGITIEKINNADDLGLLAPIKAQHKAFYEQVLSHLRPPLLLTHDETLIVNGLKRDFDRPAPPSAHIVSLDHVSTHQASVLFFSMDAVCEQADALEVLHPRTDIYWLNCGQLHDPETRHVFTTQDKGFSPYIRLRPFVR